MTSSCSKNKLSFLFFKKCYEIYMNAFELTTNNYIKINLVKKNNVCVGNFELNESLM